MEFYAVLDQVVALLQQRSRVTYRTLKREFQLDEERLDDLKEELLYAHPEIMDDEGHGLIWKGDRGKSPLALPTAQQHHPPVSYTPPHLAERIRAEQAALEARQYLRRNERGLLLLSLGICIILSIFCRLIEIGGGCVAVS